MQPLHVAFYALLISNNTRYIDYSPHEKMFAVTSNSPQIQGWVMAQVAKCPSVHGGWSSDHLIPFVQQLGSSGSQFSLCHSTAYSHYLSPHHASSLYAEPGPSSYNSEGKRSSFLSDENSYCESDSSEEESTRSQFEVSSDGEPNRDSMVVPSEHRAQTYAQIVSRKRGAVESGGLSALNELNACNHNEERLIEEAESEDRVPRICLTECADGHRVVDAREVEKKLLQQNNSWLPQHHEHSGNEQELSKNCGSDSTTGGNCHRGCDTGYSSRCSTPRGPPSVCLEEEGAVQELDEEGKQGDKRQLDRHTQRESRSQSPSAGSVSSQGSYQQPPPKRRQNQTHNSTPGENQNYRNWGHYNNRPWQNYADHNYRGNQWYRDYHGRGGSWGANNGTGVCEGGGTGWYRYNQPRNGYHNNKNFNSQHNNGYNNRPAVTGDFQFPRPANRHIQVKLPVSTAGKFTHFDLDDRSHPNWATNSPDCQDPPGLLGFPEWDALSCQVWATFRTHQQTNATFYRKDQLRMKIWKVVRNAFPNSHLFIVGSSLSGFGADTSDVDLCLMLMPGDVDQRFEAPVILQIVQDQLKYSGHFEQLNLIRAQVPIMKFRDKITKIDADLNCNNAVGVRNTHLLNAYAQLDWRVRPLVLCAKLWAQHHGINNAKDMTISSYSLALMVIHYLQCGVEPAVLPCLHKCFPDKFRPNIAVHSISITERLPSFTSHNTTPVGKLFLGFLEYFAQHFKYVESAISVRVGNTLETDLCRHAHSKKNDSRCWKFLCIEEPFDLTNTAKAMYDEVIFARVKRVFADSFTKLAASRDLASIMKL